MYGLDAVHYGVAPILEPEIHQSRDEFISYHTRIYESILDGDGQKAYDAMLGHLSRVGSLITNKSECPAEAYDE
jgi:DNA-binding FadR family transcriptional regulator